MRPLDKVGSIAVAGALVLVTTLVAVPAALGQEGAGTGDGTVAMISGSAAPPQGDRPAQALLEDAGWQVTVFDDDAVPANSQLESFDVVVIMSSVVPAKLPLRLRDLEIGLLNSEIHFAIGLGLATEVSNINGQSQLAISSVSPFTDGVPTGVQSVSSAVDFGVGLPGPGATIVAETVDRKFSAIFVYDFDDALVGGGSATARRTQFFLNYATPAALGEIGKLLFLNSVSWLTETPPQPTTTSTTTTGTTTTSTTTTSTTTTSTTTTSTTTTTVVDGGGEPGGPVEEAPGLAIWNDPIVHFEIRSGENVRWKIQQVFICEPRFEPLEGCDGSLQLSDGGWVDSRIVTYRPREYEAISECDEQYSCLNTEDYRIVIEVDGRPYRLHRAPTEMVEEWGEWLLGELPMAVNDHVATQVNTSITIDVLWNDYWDENGDAPCAGVHEVEHGTALGTENCTIVYTPEPGFEGIDTITYGIEGGGENLPWDFPWDQVRYMGYVTVVVGEAPPPTTVPPPPPPARVSFVSGTLSTAKDLPFIARLHHLGHDVAVFDDDTVKPSDVEGTLVVISSSVSPTKARPFAAAIDEPVVTWEPYISSQLGILPPQYPASFAGEADYGSVVLRLSPGCCMGHLLDGIVSPGPWGSRLVNPLITSGTRWNRLTGFDGSMYAETPVAVATADNTGVDYPDIMIAATYNRVMLPWTYQTQDKLTVDGWTLFDNAVAAVDRYVGN